MWLFLTHCLKNLLFIIKIFLILVSRHLNSNMHIEPILYAIIITQEDTKKCKRFLSMTALFQFCILFNELFRFWFKFLTGYCIIKSKYTESNHYVFTLPSVRTHKTCFSRFFFFKDDHLSKEITVCSSVIFVINYLFLENTALFIVISLL